MTWYSPLESVSVMVPELDFFSYFEIESKCLIKTPHQRKYYEATIQIELENRYAFTCMFGRILGQS
jgi:hypothetical protein